jgi:hypothetical protein
MTEKQQNNKKVSAARTPDSYSATRTPHRHDRETTKQQKSQRRTDAGQLLSHPDATQA